MPKYKTSRRRSNLPEKKEEEFDQEIIDIARVTRVMGGGKRMSFRACVVLGDRKGRVGVGIKKGPDVTLAIQKAVASAKKNLFKITLQDGTIPHQVIEKYCAARVMIKPAKSGRGVIAGGPVRAVLEVAGVKNVVSKMLGSKNKVNNAWATLNALKRLKTKEKISELRS